MNYISIYIYSTFPDRYNFFVKEFFISLCFIVFIKGVMNKGLLFLVDFTDEDAVIFYIFINIGIILGIS